MDVSGFIAGIADPVRQADAVRLDALFRDVTGWVPQMHSGSIIGYGLYDYTYESGRSGTSLATGFSPRKASLVLYIMPGYADFGPILGRLGKYKTGKACLYVNRLADVDIDVLAELIRAGLDDLATKWPVRAG